MRRTLNDLSGPCFLPEVMAGEVYEKSKGNYLVMLNEISTDPKDLTECNSGHNWWDLTLGHWPSPCFS